MESAWPGNTFGPCPLQNFAESPSYGINPSAHPQMNEWMKNMRYTCTVGCHVGIKRAKPCHLQHVGPGRHCIEETSHTQKEKHWMTSLISGAEDLMSQRSRAGLGSRRLREEGDENRVSFATGLKLHADESPKSWCSHSRMPAAHKTHPVLK